MARGLLLPILLLAFGCITASFARPDPKPIAPQFVLAFSNVRHLTQACQDQYQECATWAQDGECDWLLDGQPVTLFCPSSCNTCGNNGGCQDQYQQCVEWASEGKCAAGWVLNGQPVGTVVCPFSCNHCGGGGGGGGGNGGQLDPSDWLGAHNYYRSLHGVPALVSDDNLIASAQNYANYLASNCLFQHSGTNGVGENLAAGYADWASAVQAWYDEISQYDFSNPGFSEATGHFTQVVWESTTNVGCGVLSNPGCPYNNYYVCQYTPPGNVIGYFGENVPPPLQKK